MTAAKLKNFRFDERYAGLLAFLAERFDVSEAEIIRRALDHVNMEYGLELALADRFIQQLRERHGGDARMDFRLIDNGIRTVSAPRHYAPRYMPDDVELRIDGKPDPGLIPMVALGTIEERMAGVERCRILLYPSVGKTKAYVTGAAGRSPRLYIGELDPASPAGLSIRVGDLRKEMQVFAWERDRQWGVGDSEGIEEVPPAFEAHEATLTA